MATSKLVFIDIDGTLADENHIVPESAQAACHEAQRNGHKLFICTGRSMPKIERSILDLGFDGVVSVAGAQANVGDTILFQHLVSAEAVDAAMEYFKLHHIESYQWQGADGMYISEGYRRHLESKGKAFNRGEFAKFWHLLDEVEVPFGSTLGESIKVSKGSYFTGPDPDVTFEQTKQDLSPWFELVHGSYDKISPNNGELLINGIDKGTAVRDVADALGYTIADTIAIGDSDNDTAMLKAAGTSVAMGNAIHGIERFCNLQTTDIHDNGLANAFRALGLV
ncbi:HAD family hydrolase [Bifidobacterium imperatoris]|uniref:Hydrolase n=1 Tax=Bifidobacterium imperatoris TaxID=2020965 RepID=A0A2N5IRM3_9BIFI|nr:HAD family hydrolase [Bifidobacterium imperatoris]PLS24614.1 hydrolase [Bifidobacterium imperatoris]QSY57409.1 HAD family hydrolase [Bifidobacterium imperatoris]